MEKKNLLKMTYFMVETIHQCLQLGLITYSHHISPLQTYEKKKYSKRFTGNCICPQSSKSYFQDTFEGHGLPKYRIRHYAV